MDFIKEHLGFILTILCTYVIGILLVIVQYHALTDDKNFLNVFLDTLIPTTITYVLGCVLVNIADLLQEKADDYIFTILTCFFVVVYILVFVIYVMMGFSCGWAIVETIFTALLLILNILSYKEKNKHRNHGLV